MQGPCTIYTAKVAKRIRVDRPIREIRIQNSQSTGWIPWIAWTLRRTEAGRLALAMGYADFVAKSSSSRASCTLRPRAGTDPQTEPWRKRAIHFIWVDALILHSHPLLDLAAIKEYTGYGPGSRAGAEKRRLRPAMWLTRIGRLVEIIDSYPVDGVILGCTELPLILRQEDCSVLLLNTLDLHTQAALDYALAE
jgi:hypothetical protein